MRATFAPILDLLDEGLGLYRRAFTRFLLLTMIVALPLGLVAAAFFLASEWLEGGVGVALAIGVAIFGLPLGLYVAGALSRAAAMAADGEPVDLRRALAIRPRRALGMGCYGSLFLLVANVAVGTVSGLCFCAAYVLIGGGIIAVAAGLSSGGAIGQAATVLAMLVSAIGVLSIYAASLVVNGAVYGSAIFVMQPFVQDDLPMGAAVQRSLDLLGFRLGSNLLAFLCTSLVFGAAALAATLAIGLLAPLPALFLLGAESPAARAISAAAWVLGVSAATPLLPIWMALLYRRRRAAREGEDLAAGLAALRADSAPFA